MLEREPSVTENCAEDLATERSPPHYRRPESNGRVAPLLLLLLFVNLAMSLYQLPLNRAVERRLCREYYSKHDPRVIEPDGGVDERLCKIDHVQRALGSIQGAMETLWIVGDFIMTIPLGFLAQRYGRRLVLNLNICSRLFMIGWAVVVGSFEALLPTKAVIAGPVLSFLGGDCVFNSVIYALASDLTDDAVRRAIYFGYISSISYVVALLGPAMASTTMSLLLWLPFYLGMAVLGLALVIVPVVAPSHRVSRARHGAHQEEDEQRRGLLSSPILKAQDARRGTFIFRSVVDHIYTLVAIVASHPWNFSLLLFSFFLTSLASADTKLLVQYISAKYQWTFASAGYLISGKAVVNFALLTLVIPWFLRTRRLDDVNSVDQANVRYAKYCLVVSVLGALGIAAAVEFWALVPSLVVYALGSALPIFTLSLLKSTQFCPQNSEDNNAPNASGADNHVFSIVMLVKTMGSLLGAPLMAALWVRGIDIGGLALGFPYFVSALCYAMAMLVFSAIRLN